MGGPNPDRVPIHRLRHGCETVGQMYEQRWKLQALCLDCQLRMDVDVRPIIAVKGAKFSLWNKVGRCRRIGCGGKVRFYGSAPGMNGFSPLTTPKPETAPIAGQVRTLGP